jgi:DNA-binding NarL/FixJ family response regulator
MIRLQQDLELAGLATSAQEALELFRERMPDVVIMDLDLPQAAAIQSITQICRLQPNVCVIGLFTQDLVTQIRECLERKA